MKLPRRMRGAEILNADGKPVVVARGTQMLLPGQPATSFV
jgi:hypothetical protein